MTKCFGEEGYCATGDSECSIKRPFWSLLIATLAPSWFIGSNSLSGQPGHALPDGMIWRRLRARSESRSRTEHFRLFGTWEINFHNLKDFSILPSGSITVGFTAIGMEPNVRYRLITCMVLFERKQLLVLCMVLSGWSRNQQLSIRKLGKQLLLLRMAPAVIYSKRSKQILLLRVIPSG